MGQYWGEHGALETPQLPQSLHTPSPKRVHLVLPGSLHPTRKMAKLGIWLRQRHWGAMPSNRARDLICHPRLMVPGKSQEKGGTRAPSPQGCPTLTGLTEGLGKAPERQTLKRPGLRYDSESRAGHWLGTVPTVGLSPPPEQA